MNEIYWLLLLVLTFGAVLLFYRLYGAWGLLLWMPVAVIVANLQVIKLVRLFGFDATLGNIAYASCFLATDILSENHGRRMARKAVGVGFLAMAVTTALMQLALAFEPAPDDFAQESMRVLFGFLPRLTLASLAAYGISQVHDIWLYNLLKRRVADGRRLWLRNNLSTLASQAIDTGLFVWIAFWGVHPLPVLWQIFWTTYWIKVLAAAADTPILYLARRMRPRTFETVETA